jgi:hypothetical protein
MGLNGAPHPPSLQGGFVRPKREPRVSRKEKVAISSFLLIIMITVLLLPGIIGDWGSTQQTTDIQREFGTEEELAAIMTAESMDMARAMGTERISWAHNRSNNPPFFMVNVTDGETIAYFKQRIDGLDEMNHRYDADFSYLAECQFVDRLLLFPTTDIDHYRKSYQMGASNSLAEFDGDQQVLDLEGLPRVGDGYLLEDVYIIRQTLNYDEDIRYDETKRIWIWQLVILDHDLNLMVLMVDANQATVVSCY